MLNLLISLLFIFSTASSNEGESASNLDALELEQQYLEVANKLAEVQNQEGPCGAIEAYTTDIVASLVQAKRYYDVNASFNTQTERVFSPSEAVLTSLSSTFVLREIMGRVDYSNLQSFENALSGVVMHGPSPGAFGHTSYLIFGNDNAVFDRKMVFDTEGNPVWQNFKGRYKVEEQNEFGVVVTIYYEEDGYETRFVLNYSFEINQWYMLPLKTIEFFKNPFVDGYVDLPDECSA
jgi:hypothetical protein